MLDTNVYRARMLNVVRALQEDTDPENFSMHYWGKRSAALDEGATCGTPMCVLGHYAARTDLQGAFKLTRNGDLRDSSNDRTVTLGMSGNQRPIMVHFGITEIESEGLFSLNGCGFANTPQQAIDFLLAFVAAKWSLPAPVVQDFTVVREAKVLVHEMDRELVYV